MSFNQYCKTTEKLKTEPYEIPIRIRAGNGSEINNQGECDITLRIGHAKFMKECVSLNLPTDVSQTS